MQKNAKKKHDRLAIVVALVAPNYSVNVSFLNFQNRSKIERLQQKMQKNAKKCKKMQKFRHIKFRYMVSFV